MPALVNYNGDDELYSERSVYSDPSIMLSVGALTDLYCSPRKRIRISGPYVVEGFMSGKVNKPSIEILPDECLFEIFTRCGALERSASACVSKHWLKLLGSVRNSELCRSKSHQGKSAAKKGDEMSSADEDLEIECDGYLTRSLEGKKATDLRLVAIAVGTSSRGGLGKLSVRGNNSIRGVTNFGLSAIARGCPTLRSLSLWSVPSVGDEGLIEIARECHSLEKLDLSNCPYISDRGLVAIAENCPNMTSLTIESCSNIGNEGLKAIADRCRKLQSLIIKECPLVGDYGVVSVISSASTTLTKVKLQVLNIGDYSLAAVGHYGKAITNLTLCGLQNVSEKGFWVMGNAKGLQMLASLSITSCRGTTDVSLEAIGKGCPNLKHMFLHKCCFVSDNGLVAFAKAAGSLDSLLLEECNRISEIGIINLLSNSKSKLKSLSVIKCMGIKGMPLEADILSPCESLRSLTIQSCPGFNSSCLATVGKLCPKLHNLDLSGHSDITDMALMPLLESCETGLVKVNLSDCVNLTDESISALARLNGGTLEVLNLDGCKKVTDASLVAIADNCLFLKDLDVSKCSITDRGLAALSGGMQLSLQVLSLSGCNLVSNRSVPHLMKLGQTLVGLNLQHCNSISSGKIEALVEFLWRCDILS